MKKEFFKILLLIMCLIPFESIFSMEYDRRQFDHYQDSSQINGENCDQKNTQRNIMKCASCLGKTHSGNPIFDCNHNFCTNCIVHLMQSTDDLKQLSCPLISCMSSLKPEPVEYLSKKAKSVMLKFLKNKRNKGMVRKYNATEKPKTKVYPEKHKPNPRRKKHLETWTKSSLQAEHAQKRRLARFERRGISDFSNKGRANVASNAIAIMDETSKVLEVINPIEQMEEGEGIWESLHCETCDEINCEDYKIFDCSHTFCGECMDKILKDAYLTKASLLCPLPDCQKAAQADKLSTLDPKLYYKAHLIMSTSPVSSRNHPEAPAPLPSAITNTNSAEGENELPKSQPQARKTKLNANNVPENHSSSKKVNGIALSMIGALGCALLKYNFSRNPLNNKSTNTKTIAARALSYLKSTSQVWTPPALSAALFMALTAKNTNLTNHVQKGIQPILNKIGLSDLKKSNFFLKTVGNKHVVNAGISVIAGALVKISSVVLNSKKKNLTQKS